MRIFSSYLQISITMLLVFRKKNAKKSVYNQLIIQETQFLNYEFLNLKKSTIK